MALNGFVANAAKTALIFMNVSSNQNKMEAMEPFLIMIDKTKVTQEQSTKLLGKTLDEKKMEHSNKQTHLIPKLKTVPHKKT